MSANPFLGKVVTLAIADGGSRNGVEGGGQATVFAVPPSGSIIVDHPPWLWPMTERDLLSSFWALASRADRVVSFRGRGFDLPFLLRRSAVHGVPARVDLCSMYENPERDRVLLGPHIDLHELLSQHFNGPSSAAVVSWALGHNLLQEIVLEGNGDAASARDEIVLVAERAAKAVETVAAIYRRVRDNLLRHEGEGS